MMKQYLLFSSFQISGDLKYWHDKTFFPLFFLNRCVAADSCSYFENEERSWFSEPVPSVHHWRGELRRDLLLGKIVMSLAVRFCLTVELMDTNLRSFSYLLLKTLTFSLILGSVWFVGAVCSADHRVGEELNCLPGFFSFFFFFFFYFLLF